MENSKYKSMTEDDFNSIKEMLDDGKLSKTDVGHITGRGSGTVWIVAKARDFEEYKRIRGQYNGASISRKKASQRAEQPQPIASISPSVFGVGEDFESPSTKVNKWKQVNPEMFTRIHELANLRVSKADISRIVGKSQSAVANVLKAKTWDQYEEIKRQLKIKREAELKPTISPVATVKPASDVEEMQMVVDEFRSLYQSLDAAFKKMGY